MRYIVIVWLMAWACWCNLCPTDRGAAFTEKGKQEDTSLAGVSVADSIAYELAASLATHIDLPEELPNVGDTLCAIVRNDTIFAEYWHDQPEQRNKFRYIHGN